jgi:DNA polymerase elongation subunit (family B)
MSKMKILTLDIETSPNLVYAWGLWQQNIPISFIVKPTYVLSWSAKWLGKKKVYYKSCNDEDFLQTIWDMIDDADAVVHYNGVAFDMKHLNREFVEAGMNKPLMPKDIDLLRTVRTQFKYPSNKLDYVADRLLGEKKGDTGGFATWIGCMEGKAWAWNIMKKYNKQDVVITEKLYLKIRGWIKGHPNHGLYIEDQDNPICRNCGSDHVHRQGYQRLNVNSYQRYRCADCGAQMRGRRRVAGGKNAKQTTL